LAREKGFDAPIARRWRRLRGPGGRGGRATPRGLRSEGGRATTVYVTSVVGEWAHLLCRLTRRTRTKRREVGPLVAPARLAANLGCRAYDLSDRRRGQPRRRVVRSGACARRFVRVPGMRWLPPRGSPRPSRRSPDGRFPPVGQDEREAGGSLRAIIPPSLSLSPTAWVDGARVRLNARRHLTYWRRGLPDTSRTSRARSSGSCGPNWFRRRGPETHIGFFTILLASRTERVLAFEPDERNRGRPGRQPLAQLARERRRRRRGLRGPRGGLDFVTDRGRGPRVPSRPRTTASTQGLESECPCIAWDGLPSRTVSPGRAPIS